MAQHCASGLNVKPEILVTDIF